jgi:hypothetical protein
MQPKYGALKTAALVLAAHHAPSGVPSALAAESLISSDAYLPKGEVLPMVRIAAIGHGSLFNSADVSRPDLKPATEQLLLSTCNWLLQRDDRLIQADRVWTYPRARLSSREKTLWRLGASIGLPVLFAYLGLMVLLVRRMR